MTETIRLRERRKSGRMEAEIKEGQGQPALSIRSEER